MSTLVLDVNKEQEQILEGLLQYMNISFQKIAPSEDFWDSLSSSTKTRIEKGLSDVEKGKYSSAKSVISEMLAK